MSEIVFVVEEDETGGYVAHAVGHSIITQGETLADIEDMIRDAVSCHFDDWETPSSIRLQIVREQVIAVK